MRQRLLLVFVVTLFAAVAFPAAGQAAAPLGDQIHAFKAASFSCQVCHGTDTPTEAPKSDPCKQCHGTMADMSKLTPDAKPRNPHASHLDEITCTDCHKAHEESQIYCIACHDWQWTMPKPTAK